MDVLIMGDSHVAALGVPTAAADEPVSIVSVQAAPLRTLGLSGSGIMKRNGTYWRAAEDNVAGRIVAMMWKGNQHNEYFLLSPKPAFDVVLPALSDSVIAGAVLVPVSVIRASLQKSLGRLPGIIVALREKGAADIVLAGTPPPRGHAADLLPLLRRSSRFVKIAEQNGVNLASVDAVTPLSIRLKVWAIMQNMVREIAERAGAGWVPVPADTLDATGALRREFWAGDVTHANAEYGRKALANLTASILMRHPAARVEAA